MTELKLYHKDNLIGTISNVAPEDTFEMSGSIELTPLSEKYKPMFVYLANEETLTSGADLPFDESDLDNWFLENEKGEKRKNWHRPADWAKEIKNHHLKLIVVDEAFRLKYQALEQLRDIQEEWDVGVLLIADPGFERALSRMWHFSVRVAHVEELKRLS